jgi:DNA polymerase III alpha subunit (gram-positive type)
MGFIEHHLKVIGLPSLNLPALDVLSMARDSLDLPKYNLETTAKFFKIDCSNGLHRALDDARIAQHIFYELLGRFKAKAIASLGDLFSLYGFNNDIFKERQQDKITLLQEAIDRNLEVNLKYFVPVNIVEGKNIKPLRILRENKYTYLWYQKQAQESSRIRLSRIFEVTINS